MAQGIKTGGRNKGIPNKLTMEIKPLLEGFLKNNWEGFLKDFKSLDPINRVKVYEKLLSYALPKDLHIENSESNEPQKIVIIETVVSKSLPPLI